MATAVGSAAVLVAVVETSGISQFFGCTPLGPVAWAGVLTAVTAATAMVVLSPAWFTRRTEQLIARVELLPSTPPGAIIDHVHARCQAPSASAGAARNC
ncbi:hypothetical protein OG405_03935 [Nocardia sp. NBC_01329]|nr:hypothetical protein OG405_03935 [Nocardia sp. NBC_01329]